MPSAIAGALLFGVALVAIGARSASKTEPAVEIASATPVTTVYNAFQRKSGGVGIEPEIAFQ